MIESSNDDTYDTFPYASRQVGSPSQATTKDSHSSVDASLVTSPFGQINGHVDVLILDSQKPIVTGLGTQVEGENVALTQRQPPKSKRT